MSFVHLHTHSEYSLLDGANRLEDLVRRAVDLEMPALALTDHGCMFGAWTFQQLANRHGLKPQQRRLVRNALRKRELRHVVLLPESDVDAVGDRERVLDDLGAVRETGRDLLRGLEVQTAVV